MDPHRLGEATVVLVTADSELLDLVLSVTAVVGVEPLILSDPGLLHQHWATASMLLLGIDQATLSSPGVKDALRRNTEEALARGVFGVPSFVADGEVFWGADSIDLRLR